MTAANNTVSIEKLNNFCIEAMLKAGMSQENAQITAKVLVATDTWGTFTHGTKQLKKLLKNFRDGRMDPKAVPEITKQGQSWALYDGKRAMPMVSSVKAMETAISKAKATGIAYTVVKNSGHYGAAGYYAHMAAEADMFGLSMTNVDPCMAVPGAKEAVLGTNPIAYAAPGGKEKPVMLDIATSVVAASKIFKAADLKQPIPNNWLIDKDGLPTTDPTGYPAVGAIMPMAAHKGYGIALMIEILTGVISGSAFAKDVPCWVLEQPEPVDQSHTFIAIDINAIMPIDQFKQRMETLTGMIKETPKAEGTNEIFLPGEIEYNHKQKVLQNNQITLPKDVMDSLKGLAEDYGLESQTLFS
ncbi:MAG: Ldh family oxidoreductase [Sedimentisphaerales bacterium]|nr:Ldh family oxidoreductase [Sedimentisphaerales bacterium]